MYYLVYKITNKINGKYYIGKHETSNKDDGYLGSGKLIIAAVKKYGAENFTKEILHECNDSLEMYRKEYDLIVPNKIDSQSYNISAKDYGPQFGNDDRTKELGKRGSDKLLELLENDEDFRNNFTNAIKQSKIRYKERHGSFPWVNKKHKKESKEKIGKANSIHQRGSGNSMFGTMWVYNPKTKENLRIKKTDVIPTGYVKGRIVNVDQKCREAARKHSSNMMWITNVSTGEIKKVIKGEVPVGWTRGRKGFSANKRLK